MNKRFCASPSIIILLGSLAAFTAAPSTLRSQTTNVVINNFSFQEPANAPLADGATSVGLPGWLVVGNLLSGDIIPAPLNETVLTSNPTNAQYPGATGANPVGTMDGSQIASFRTGLLNIVGGSASQATGALLTVGVRYTLTIAVGNPQDSVFQGYNISLLSGGTTLASVSNLNEDVANGTFRDVSINYLLDPLDPLLPSLVNTPLIVSLSVPDGLNLATGYGTDFDNVRLTATQVLFVPEPSTYATVGLGLLGLVGLQAVRRRRRLLAKA